MKISFFFLQRIKLGTQPRSYRLSSLRDELNSEKLTYMRFLDQPFVSKVESRFVLFFPKYYKVYTLNRQLPDEEASIDKIREFGKIFGDLPYDERFAFYRDLG